MAFSLSSLINKTVPKSASAGVIGVDVGASSIKVVQLHLDGKRPTLDTYGELQVGPYGNVDIGRGVRLQPEQLGEAFVDIVREAAATAQQVSVAISYNASFITIMSVPERDPEKIGGMIPVEAKKYIPVPLSDVSTDWFPVSAHSEDAKSTKVLLVATHQDALKRYHAMVKAAHLATAAEEIEPFSTIRTVIGEKDPTTAIIDIGAGSTKLYLVAQGIIGKVHSITMNAVDVTLAIARVRGIDFLQAEELKRTHGIGLVRDNPALEKEFVTIFERGFREIMTMIQRYEAEESLTVDRVVLTGGGALLGGLVQYAHDIMNREVVLADPFSKIVHPAFLEDVLRQAGPSFAVAVGVALRGLES